MPRQNFRPDWPSARRVRISQAVRIGDLVYTSGQVAYDRDGNIVGRGDMSAQSRQVFANIRDVLALAGASMDDVFKITAFITDMSKYADYSAARSEAFPNDPPASSTVSTPRLVNPELLVEVEAIAYRPTLVS
ncbi:MAG: RidA family protein [SAR202 cluster bacterium]|nr:RidA family protein [SAR202 cluster bacterium]